MNITVASDAEAPEIELAPSAAELPEINVPWFCSTESPDCIFRASVRIRYGRESDFEPKLVSIGPYYHGRENLKRMEDIKVRCMSECILKLRPVGGSNIDHVSIEPFMRFESYARRFYKETFDNLSDVKFVEPFMRFESHARRFYKEKFDNLSDVKFVEMLVLDSFFVIRIMLSLSTDVYESMAFLDLNIKEAVSDLLLLENQIPLFFIYEVFYWLDPNNGNSHTLFHELLLGTFLQLDFPWWIQFDRLPINSGHLLHLYWKISEESIKKYNDHRQQLRRLAKKKKKSQEKKIKLETVWGGEVIFRPQVQKLIANATELHQTAGISFKNVEIDHYNDGYVEFSKGIMRMPCLKIDPSQTILLENLVAYENSMLLSNRTITTYIKIMDNLIDSDKDVELLQKFGVVYNTLSSHSEAATFFNNIGNHCSIDHNKNPFSDLLVNVNKYYNSSWNRSWANLRQNYFNSPWAGTSVFAGVTLLFLSGVQTYYTIFPKNH